MKIECLKNKLQKAVTITERITAKNMSLPILKNILLEANDGYLSIRATNLEVGIETKIPAKIYEPGVTAINPTIFSNFLNNLKDEDKIILTVINGNLSVSTENSNTIIKSETTDDFPTIPKISTDNKLNILAEDFIKGLKSVAFASSNSDIKPEISSVYLYIDNDLLIFVATDSFRLAEKRIKLKQNSSIESVIIPIKNTLEIVKAFEGSENEELEISSDGNQISIFGNNIHFTSRVINGVYPDYRQIMPKDYKISFDLNRDSFLQALKLNTIFADKFNQINFLLNTENKNLILNTSNQDTGENTTILNDLDIKFTDKNDNFSTCYNIRYIIDSFSIINTNKIFLGLNEVNRPLMLQSIGDDSFSYIVMPVTR